LATWATDHRQKPLSSRGQPPFFNSETTMSDESNHGLPFVQEPWHKLTGLSPARLMAKLILESFGLMNRKHYITKGQIDKLVELNEAEGGIRCVDAILTYLHRGENEHALSIRMSEGDKTRTYPKIEEHLYQMFGCRLHQNRECDDDLCKTLRRYHLERLEEMK